MNKYNKLYLIQDLVVNVIEFVPFGFFLCMWMMSTSGWPKGQAIFIMVGLGALLSLTIEFVQVWIPARDSSLADVVCNTMGTVLGAGCLVLGSRFWGLGAGRLPRLNALKGCA